MIALFVGPSFSLAPFAPLQPGTARRSAVLRSAVPQMSDDAEYSWQEELEKVLSPSTAQSDREVLLKDLLGRGPEIAKEITEAASSGSFADLVPKGSEGDQILEGIASVQRQVVDDILPQASAEAQSLLEPGKLQETVLRASADAQEAAERAPLAASAVASLLQDPARAVGLVQQEARNAFSRTPEGLETPSYLVVGGGEQYELREYSSYSIASTYLGGPAAAGDPAAAIRGFNSLTAFFVGGNADRELLDMTTPLRIDVTGSGCEMAVVLPKKFTAGTAPAPAGEKVTLRQTRAQTLAVREFTGFATDGEIQRQLSRLQEQLQRDCVSMAEFGSYSILQYNPPYTLPWLRRNEIAVAVDVATPEAPPAAEPRDSAEGAPSPAGADAVAEAEQEGLSEEVVADEEDLAPSDIAEMAEETAEAPQVADAADTEAMMEMTEDDDDLAPSD